MSQRWITAILATVLAVALGCASPKQESQQGGEPSEDTSTATSEATSQNPVTMESTVAAVCELSPTQGSNVTGTVTFTPVSGGIFVRADVTGLTPGLHGFHIHEFGDCSAADGTSAGGHLDPDEMPHAGPDAAQRHEGDLGNLVADSTGTAHYERTDTHLALEGERSILDRAIIVHAEADDYTTQPTGAAGARVACGVIRAATQ